MLERRLACLEILYSLRYKTVEIGLHLTDDEVKPALALIWKGLGENSTYHSEEIIGRLSFIAYLRKNAAEGIYDTWEAEIISYLERRLRLEHYASL